MRAAFGYPHDSKVGGILKRMAWAVSTHEGVLSTGSKRQEEKKVLLSCFFISIRRKQSIGVRVFHWGKRSRAAIVYRHPALGTAEVHSHTAPEKRSFVQRIR